MMKERCKGPWTTCTIWDIQVPKVGLDLVSWIGPYDMLAWHWRLPFLILCNGRATSLPRACCCHRRTLHQWTMHHCCRCTLRLWVFNWTLRSLLWRINIDMTDILSPSIVRLSTILLCTLVLNLVPIGFSISTIDLCFVA